MLVGLDEVAAVLVLLEPGPCAAPTVSRLERVKVRDAFRTRNPGVRRAGPTSTRHGGREGRPCVWTDAPQAPSTEERRSSFAVIA